MSTSNLMSLPVDIQWRRLAIDHDAMWQMAGDGSAHHPDLWNPSVAVFYGFPDDTSLPTGYAESKITYLKVVCTLTGCRAAPTSFDDTNQPSPWPVDPYHPSYDIVARGLSNYFGCYGAILEVVVSPYDDENVDIIDGPYFADFQPKKREVYQSVSETGEIMSESGSSLSVRKSGTSADEQETTIGIAGGPDKYARGVEKSEHGVIRNVDASREDREKFSHTTNLSQLYHLLDSYHLGTNRVVFFVHPRPYFLDPIFPAFVNGPRRLEGIQEFFLVVVQARDTPGLCVRAKLRTGHFGFEVLEEHQPTPIRNKDFTDNYSHPGSEPATQADKPYNEDYIFIDDHFLGYELDRSVHKGTNDKWSSVKEQPIPEMRGEGWLLKIDNPADASFIEDIVVSTWSGGLKIVSTQYGQGFTATVQMWVKPSSTEDEEFEYGQELEFFIQTKDIGACLNEEGGITQTPKEPRYSDGLVRLVKPPYSRVVKGADMIRLLEAQIPEALKREELAGQDSGSRASEKPNADGLRAEHVPT